MTNGCKYFIARYPQRKLPLRRGQLEVRTLGDVIISTQSEESSFKKSQNYFEIMLLSWRLHISPETIRLNDLTTAPLFSCMKRWDLLLTDADKCPPPQKKVHKYHICISPPLDGGASLLLTRHTEESFHPPLCFVSFFVYVWRALVAGANGGAVRCEGPVVGRRIWAAALKAA